MTAAAAAGPFRVGFPDQKFLRVRAKHGWSPVDQAFRRAPASEFVNLRRVEAVPHQELDQPLLPLVSGTETPVIPIRLCCQHPAGSFTHPPTPKPCEDGSEAPAQGRPQAPQAPRDRAPPRPVRSAYAQKASLCSLDLLKPTLQEEIDRRERKNLSTQLDRASFDEAHSFEDFDWDAPVTVDRDRVHNLSSLGFLERHEAIFFFGPAGVVGKTFLACALGHSARRAGRRVIFVSRDARLRLIHQSRADNSPERVLRSLLTPDLLILHAFRLPRLNAQQSIASQEVLIERHRQASPVVAFNRANDEWIPLFDDPNLAESPLDRLAHEAHQIVTERDSYRSRASRTGFPTPTELAKPDPRMNTYPGF